MTNPSSDVLERLRRKRSEDDGPHGIFEVLVNPDGPAAIAEIERLSAELEALTWLAENRALELTWGESDNDMSECAWRVHRRNGGYNDREWTLIATGETPLEALTNARAALTTVENSHERKTDADT